MQLSLLFCPVIGFVKLVWESDPEDVLDSQQLDDGVVFEALLLLNKDISKRQESSAKDSKDPKILVDTSLHVWVRTCGKYFIGFLVCMQFLLYNIPL